MNCSQCGNKMVDSFITFTTLSDGVVFVTEQVPCLECSVCGHTVFTQEVAKKLEKVASGRLIPMSNYRAYGYRYGIPVIEIQPFTFSLPAKSDSKVLVLQGTSGV